MDKKKIFKKTLNVADHRHKFFIEVKICFQVSFPFPFKKAKSLFMERKAFVALLRRLRNLSSFTIKQPKKLDFKFYGFSLVFNSN